MLSSMTLAEIQAIHQNMTNSKKWKGAHMTPMKYVTYCQNTIPSH